MIAIIVAAAENGVIGKENRLIWHLPADLKRFKALTTGHTVLMGRNTFESMGHALPRRRNIVVSRDTAYRAEGCEMARSIEEALALVPPGEVLFVIGGESLYRAFWHRADRLYLTIVHALVEGDRHVPAVEPREWRVVKQEHFPADEAHEHAYSFVEHVRNDNLQQ
ncbi:MAG: dihydrofolate reductase [Odoribacteraceae bacterium]|jgi:dihydrofolate reductase|nr:dihydrofolate reductase [Odoribacteraceae bacterium]